MTPIPPLRVLPFERPRTIEFDYVNWRGQRHRYIGVVESLEWGEYSERGKGILDDSTCWRWMLHIQIVSRDGDPRPDMGPTRRRSFILDQIEMP